MNAGRAKRPAKQVPIGWKTIAICLSQRIPFAGGLGKWFSA